MNSEERQERGTCCFCEGDCNPASQACGRCMRSLSGFSLGWNSLPMYLGTIFLKNKREEESGPEVVTEEKESISKSNLENNNKPKDKDGSSDYKRN